MERVENQTFEKMELRVGGKLYVGCTFRECLLIFSGEEDFGIDQCELDRVQFAFEGAAARVMRWIRQMKASGVDVVGD